MVELTLKFPEYEALKNNRVRLESCFDVRICLPNSIIPNNPPPDLINVRIQGEPRSIKYVQKFLKRQMNKKTVTNPQETISVPTTQESIPLITIDDEEDDISEIRRYPRTIGKKKSEVPNVSHTSKNENNMFSSSSCAKLNEASNCNLLNSVASSSAACSSSGNGSSSPSDSNQNADDSIVILSENIVSANSPAKQCQKPTRSEKETSSLKESSEVVVCNPLPDFIPLRVRNVLPPLNSYKRPRISDCVTMPSLKARRVLRPIVIDGSNVARFHGKPNHTFSCKGIKICVDYFLKRGHTEIKVLLPHFKRFMTHGSVVTTDGELLDELEKSNMVVYTPSRKVNDRRITCYDDRFIVSLACQNNGVIVSNDNYRDIIIESAEFKKTVDERLLMFCFVGDIIMIPEDPLGVHGPKLNEFLSMRV